jgi:hypothetical protein
LTQKNKILSKRKEEMEENEEIDGFICNYNVSCDFFIDGLHSIGASAGEG